MDDDCAFRGRSRPLPSDYGCTRICRLAFADLIPAVEALTVTRTDPNLKGATASNSNKPATLENGVTVSVPPFVLEGEKIRVNPTESKYIERVK